MGLLDGSSPALPNRDLASLVSPRPQGCVRKARDPGTALVPTPKGLSPEEGRLRCSGWPREGHSTQEGE